MFKPNIVDGYYEEDDYDYDDDDDDDDDDDYYYYYDNKKKNNHNHSNHKNNNNHNLVAKRTKGFTFVTLVGGYSPEPQHSYVNLYCLFPVRKSSTFTVDFPIIPIAYGDSLYRNEASSRGPSTYLH